MTTKHMTLSLRQRRIFNALLESFLDEGFRSFTIDGAAKRFQCSKSTIYTLGKSRDDVIRRVLISFFREVARRTDPDNSPRLTARDQLQGYFESIAKALEPASPAFIRDLSTEPVAREIYSTNTAAAANKIEALISSGVKQSEFTTHSPQFIAEWTRISLEAIQRGDFSSVLSSAEAYRELGKTLLFGLCGSNEQKQG